MADSEETNPKKGQIDVSQWVQEAWKGLDGNMINNAWKHIGYAENKGSNLNQKFFSNVSEEDQRKENDNKMIVLFGSIRITLQQECHLGKYNICKCSHYCKKLTMN